MRLSKNIYFSDIGLSGLFMRIAGAVSNSGKAIAADQ